MIRDLLTNKFCCANGMERNNNIVTSPRGAMKSKGIKGSNA